MIKAFQDGKDIYATIAALSFNMPYDNCLEFNPQTHEYQADGKARRGEAKSIVLGVTYGRSTVTIGEQLFGSNPNMTEDDRTKAAQKIYDGVMNSFSGLRDFMLSAQDRCRKLGFTETILGRRRHIPDMKLPEFEFKPMEGYVNPDVDPLDISTLGNREAIPQRVVDQLTKQFKGYKYWGQIVKATKALAEQKIRVVNNRQRLQEAERKVVNCVDKSTEILTKDGWKRYDEISVGDAIYSFNVDTQEIVEDVITHIHISDEPTEVIDFISPTFKASSTLNHRWVVWDDDIGPIINTTEDILENTISSSIIRVADNSFDETDKYSDDQLVEIGSMIVTERVEIEDGTSVIDFVSSLSSRQANVVVDSVLSHSEHEDEYKCATKFEADMFQYLCLRAGIATNMHDCSGSYNVLLVNSRTDAINTYPESRRIAEDGVWCVTTTNGTWISRHDGCVSITGNSIIQGSAAELTKMAILKLEHNQRWHEIGGKFIIPVHDELIAEVPLEHREEGEKLLKESMETAGDFLPFPIYCDVTTTYRWYGLEVDHDYVKPTTIDTVEPEEVQWIQYMLFENEYQLPVYKEPDGSKPRGNAAMGINGRRSDEMDAAIFDYMNRYNISEDQFIDHIEYLTIHGRVKEENK